VRLRSWSEFTYPFLPLRRLISRSINFGNEGMRFTFAMRKIPWPHGVDASAPGDDPSLIRARLYVANFST
jgi:hypothetical protein